MEIEWEKVEKTKADIEDKNIEDKGKGKDKGKYIEDKCIEEKVIDIYKKIMNGKIDEKYLNTITNNTFFNIDKLVTSLENNIEGFINAEEYGLTYYLLYVILGILFIRIIKNWLIK